MKILEVTVRFSVKTKAEEEKVCQFLSISGGIADLPKDTGVKAEGPVAYSPSSDRTRLAAEALSKCKRVGVLRLEVLEVWANAFPHVDLAAEILKAEAWAESKGVTRTVRGWQKSLGSWMAKAQDNSRGSATPQVTPKPSIPVVAESEVKEWIEAAS